MVPSIKELAAEKFDIFKAILFVENPLTPEQEQIIITYPVNDVLETRLRKWVYRPEEAKLETKGIQENHEHISAVGVERSIRVEPSKIDKLVNNIGELLNIKTNLKQLTQLGYQGRITWEQLTKAVQKLDQLIAVFHEDIMDLRMVPVRQIFTRFPRIIRDVAKKKNKQVELTIFGEDTEIDKQVAENLADPLTHMVRNAVDHGLENGAERIAIGKPEVGQVKLGAYKDGDYIVISISDDGRGLDPKQIRDKAVKNGLIKNEQQLSDDEIFKLIFAPGFSTAEKVSDISGRGVGMDVVLNSINLLKGDIEVNTQLNRGTTFLLKVPLTLAIIQTLLVKIGDQSFGIPSGDVLESLLIDGNEIHTVADQMIYNWRQDAFPIIDLRKRFGVQNDAESDQIPLVVFKNSYGKMGLIVDELVGQEEVVIKQINPAFPNNPTIAGAAILGDGEIALMINVHNIQSN
jgi:two-component system chemotaxis sensor kinase CheA